jgi:hypothetical protein
VGRTATLGVLSACVSCPHVAKPLSAETQCPVPCFADDKCPDMFMEGMLKPLLAVISGISGSLLFIMLLISAALVQVKRKKKNTLKYMLFSFSFIFIESSLTYSYFFCFCFSWEASRI